jgi:histidine triad (HIT) family protein
VSACLFCRIAAGTLGTRVAEGPGWCAFDDIAPQAPTHVLVIPTQHVASLNALTEADDALVGRILRAARDLARTRGIADRGYRLVCNTNAEGGQSVAHLHWHLLGGRQMTWPPG